MNDNIDVKLCAKFDYFSDQNKRVIRLNIAYCFIGIGPIMYHM